MAAPDVANAWYKVGQLVWFAPSVTGGKFKGRVTDVLWDDVFKEWRYEVKVTGRGGHLYKTGSHTWVGKTSVSERNK